MNFLGQLIFSLALPLAMVVSWHATALSQSAAPQNQKSPVPMHPESLPNAPTPGKMILANTTWSIAIHGGAGGSLDRWTAEQQQARLDGLAAALQVGKEMLDKSHHAVDVVEAVVQVLEDNPNFNAGRGSVLNNVGQVSMDASIMDGSDLSCGAVANVTTVKNPIRLARAVRDKTSHVFLCGDPADEFAKELGLKQELQDYFKTDDQIKSWKAWKDKQAAKKEATSQQELPKGQDRLFYLGTVGCVVRDANGNLAAATSTGGLLGKRYGRVGDSPVIGAGTYANNATCAVSGTGVGELYIKHHIASAVSSRIEFLNESLEQAVQFAIQKTLPEDSGGLIAIDRFGNIQLQYNTPIMARGQANSQGLFQVGLKDLVDRK